MLHFLGNYFGASDPFASKEVQTADQKRQEQAAQEQWGKELVSELEKEHAASKKAAEEAEAALRPPPGPDYYGAGRAGVSTALSLRAQAEAGRPVLSTGGKSPRVTAGGGYYGPGYSDTGQQKPASFIQRNKWLLIGAGGGLILTVLTTALLLKKRRS